MLKVVRFLHSEFHIPKCNGESAVLESPVVPPREEDRAELFGI